MRSDFACAVLLFLMTAPAFAGDLAGADLYKKALPTIMTLNVVKADGRAVGTGFLAIKDGLAVTAWHVVKGAVSVKAKFANGEVDEVTGIVDKDETADVALVRVKEFGFPMLALNPVEPEIGASSFAIGAPEGLEFTISNGIISQIRELNGIKNLQFTCPISPGNSGGPLMAADGSVIGVVDSTLVDAQNVNFAIPIRKVLALDSTLPTQPWGSVKVAAEVSGDGGVVDQAIAAALAAYVDGLTEFTKADVSLLRRDPYFAIDKDYYHSIIAIGDARAKLQNVGIHSDDADQVQLVADMTDLLNKEVDMLTLLSKAIQYDANDQYGWDSQATQENYAACLAVYENLKAAQSPSLSKWITRSYFKSKFSVGQANTIATVLNPVAYIVGGVAILDKPTEIHGLEKSMICSKLGLKNGDVILKIDDVDVSSLMDINTSVKLNAGKKIKIACEREGKSLVLTPTVPKDLPSTAFDIERH